MRLRLVIAAVLLWPVVSFGGGLSELAARIDQPGIGARVAFEGPLRFGRAAIERGAGATVRPLMAGDENCGVAISGPATFRLVIDDPFSAPIGERNLDRASKLDAREAKGNLEVTFEVDSAIVWWWEAPGSVEGDGEPRGSSALPEWAAEALDDPAFSRRPWS